MKQFMDAVDIILSETAYGKMERGEALVAIQQELFDARKRNPLTPKEKQMTDSEMLKVIYDYVIAQGKPVNSQPKLDFESYPKNMPVMTYVDAVKYVATLGEGWTIPTLEQVRIQYANKDSINGEPFITDNSGSGCPDWYWSSTEIRVNPSGVHIVRFSDGVESWFRKGSGQLSCRPVRLVAAPSLG